jgi:hypothetical protein
MLQDRDSTSVGRPSECDHVRNETIHFTAVEGKLVRGEASSAQGLVR